MKTRVAHNIVRLPPPCLPTQGSRAVTANSEEEHLGKPEVKTRLKQGQAEPELLAPEGPAGGRPQGGLGRRGTGHAQPVPCTFTPPLGQRSQDTPDSRINSLKEQN